MWMGEYSALSYCILAAQRLPLCQNTQISNAGYSLQHKTSGENATERLYRSLFTYQLLYNLCAPTWIEICLVPAEPADCRSTYGSLYIPNGSSALHSSTLNSSYHQSAVFQLEHLVSWQLRTWNSSEWAECFWVNYRKIGTQMFLNPSLLSILTLTMDVLGLLRVQGSLGHILLELNHFYLKAWSWLCNIYVYML